MQQQKCMQICCMKISFQASTEVLRLNAQPSKIKWGALR